MLYDQGARNFWIHNTGPLGCITQNLAKFGTDLSKLDEIGCLTNHNQAAKLFNLQLHALTMKLRGQYPDANITYVDIFSIKFNLIENYSRYGMPQSLFGSNLHDNYNSERTYWNSINLFALILQALSNR